MSRTSAVAVLLVFALVLTAHAFAVELVTNGGFETGDFTGWSGFGMWSVAGPGGTPWTHDSSVGPAAGNWYVIADWIGFNTSVLYQTLHVPSPGTVDLTFDMFLNCWPGERPPPSPFGLSGPFDSSDYNFCRVDLLNDGAGPLSTDPADIVQTFMVGHSVLDDVLAGYGHYSFTTPDASPGDYLLRFYVYAGSPVFNAGIDNVSANFTPNDPSIPEPSSLLFLLTALPFATRLRRRK